MIVSFILSKQNTGHISFILIPIIIKIKQTQSILKSNVYGLSSTYKFDVLLARLVLLQIYEPTVTQSVKAMS